VRFALRYGFVTEMNDALLAGALDFAFVDEFNLDRRVRVERVYDETLILCAARELVKAKGFVREGRESFEKLDYVDYQTGEPVLRMWFKHHLGKSNVHLNVRATVMDVQGVARLILSGMAAGVLPGHLVSKLKDEGRRLMQFRGCGRALHNTISVGYLPERTQSAAAAAAMRWFLEALRKRKQDA
jgi:DNA-binding transcriptional LysR family regulator